MQNKKGFTLIELLVVIAIIAVLATLAVVSLTSAQEAARDTERIADIRATQSALELAFNADNEYPTVATNTNAACDTAVLATWSDLATELQDYLNGLPSDPSSNAYTYMTDSQGYVLQAVLENTSHEALTSSYSTDLDGSALATEWCGLDSNDNQIDGESTVVNCDPLVTDGVYCVVGGDVTP